MRRDHVLPDKDVGLPFLYKSHPKELFYTQESTNHRDTIYLLVLSVMTFSFDRKTNLTARLHFHAHFISTFDAKSIDARFFFLWLLYIHALSKGLNPRVNVLA